MAQRSIRIDDLVNRARVRADMVDSEFWTAPQCTDLAEAKFHAFYLKACGKFEEFFTTRRVVTTTANNSTVQLAGFYNLLKLRGVQHEFEWFLRKIDLLEAPDLVGRNSTGKPQFYSWRIDPEIEFPFLDLFATPNSAYRLVVHYVPMVGLQQLQQTLGEQKALYMLAGWDEYIVLKMAIAMKDREESDCSVLITEAAELEAAMDKQMTPSDLGEPAGVIQRGPRGGGIDFYSDPEDYLG